MCRQKRYFNFFSILESFIHDSGLFFCLKLRNSQNHWTMMMCRYTLAHETSSFIIQNRFNAPVWTYYFILFFVKVSSAHYYLRLNRNERKWECKSIHLQQQQSSVFFFAFNTYILAFAILFNSDNINCSDDQVKYEFISKNTTVFGAFVKWSCMRVIDSHQRTTHFIIFHQLINFIFRFVLAFDRSFDAKKKFKKKIIPKLTFLARISWINQSHRNLFHFVFFRGACQIDFVLSAEAPEFVPQFHKPPVIANEMAGNIGPPLIHHQGIPLHQQQLQHSQMPHPSTSGKKKHIFQSTAGRHKNVESISNAFSTQINRLLHQSGEAGDAASTAVTPS